MEANIVDEAAKEKLIFEDTNLDFTDSLIDIQTLSIREREYLTYLENRQQLHVNKPAGVVEEVSVNMHSKQPVRKDEKQIALEDLAC